MEKLIVTKENYLGLSKCKNTDQPRIDLQGSLYFYLENVEIGGTAKKKVPYYEIDNTIYSDKTNSPYHEGESCKIQIDDSFLQDFDIDILWSLEDKFEEYFEEFAAQEAEDEWKYLNSLPY